MPTYLTAQALRDLSGSPGPHTAELELKSVQPPTGSWDVFLSHSFRDAWVILGVRRLLERAGLRVYVDWIDDRQLDRSYVNAATASVLRERMKDSRTLIYATSRAATTSRWMPWELGEFDGMKGESRIAIFPIDNGERGSFSGQEYLGLYKVVEKLPYAIDPTEARVVSQDRMRSQSIRTFGQGQPNYTPWTWS